MTLDALDGRIQLRGLTGEGGAGEVHRAWDTRLERAVAVKLPRGDNPREAERLLIEARLQARVDHPHVVRVHEVGSLAGRPCIVLQLVDGRPLSALAAELPLAERVALLRQAAEGLHAAHLQGLVHRDVKPGNVLVEETAEGRRALLGDFGLARSDEGGGLTRTGVPAGTLEYMSPEQLLGAGLVDHRADVYGLGAALYALVAGRPPFRSASPAEGDEISSGLFRRVLEQEPEPLARAAPGAPRELGLVAARAMEKDPGARYGSAEEFAAELSRFLEGIPVLARPPAPSERIWKWARRNRAASRALAAAALAILAAAAFGVWSSRRSSQEALEAARLGALAASLDARMRMEHLAKPHDLRPALAEVRAEAERLRPLSRRGSGPAAFALGEALQILGDLDGARGALERAQDLGFRPAALDESLGMVLTLIHEREVRLADQLGPEDRTARLADLRRTLVEPARALLARATDGWRESWRAASLALLDGDHARAAELAERGLRTDPGRYELLELEARGVLAEARLHGLADHLDDARAALERAIALLEQAQDAARSDPDVLLLLADARQRRADTFLQQGGAVEEDVAAALRAVELGRVLQADRPELDLIRGRALLTRGRSAMLGGRADALPTLRESIDLFRRAVAVSPLDPAPRAALGSASYLVALFLHATTEATSPELLGEALGAVREGLLRSARNTELQRALSALLLEQGEELLEAGNPAGPVFREAVEACQAGRAVDPRHAPAFAEVEARALRGLAKDAWRDGRDPRADFLRAVALGDEMLRNSQGRRSAVTQLAQTLGELAMVELAAGDDPLPELIRARDLVRTMGRGIAADTLFQAVIQASIAMVRAELGRDAAPDIAEANDLLRMVRGMGLALGDSAEVSGILAIAGARSELRSGRSPAAALRRAHATLGTLVAQAPGYPEGQKWLAQAHLVGALAARSSAARAEEARKGLAAVGRLAELSPRDPVAYALRARLHLAAGDRAAARAALDRAYALQPLLRGNRDARAAEAELAR